MTVHRLPHGFTNSRSTEYPTATGMVVLSDAERANSLHEFSSSNPCLLYIVRSNPQSWVRVINERLGDSQVMGQDDFRLMPYGCNLTIEMGPYEQAVAFDMGDDEVYLGVDHGHLDHLSNRPYHIVYGGCGEHVVCVTKLGVLAVMSPQVSSVELTSAGPIWGTVLSGGFVLCNNGGEVEKFLPGDGFLIEAGTKFRVTDALRCTTLIYRRSEIVPTSQLGSETLPVAGYAQAF